MDDIIFKIESCLVRHIISWEKSKIKLLSSHGIKHTENVRKTLSDFDCICSEVTLTITRLRMQKVQEYKKGRVWYSVLMRRDFCMGEWSEVKGSFSKKVRDKHFNTMLRTKNVELWDE